MSDDFQTAVEIEADPRDVWAVLTTPALMSNWMGGDEMKIEVDTDWGKGNPIFIRGFHHIAFTNKGVVLEFDKESRLTYSHLSSVSRLPESPESYSVLDFQLIPQEGHTRLTLDISQFPTETIRKHLEFYWRSTMVAIKRAVEARTG